MSSKMNFDKSFDEDWHLTNDGSKDMLLTWTDKFYRFVIHHKVPGEKMFGKPAYSPKKKENFIVFDTVNGKAQVFKSKNSAFKHVLENLFNQFFEDVEKQIKSL